MNEGQVEYWVLDNNKAIKTGLPTFNESVKTLADYLKTKNTFSFGSMQIIDNRGNVHVDIK